MAKGSWKRRIAWLAPMVACVAVLAWASAAAAAAPGDTAFQYDLENAQAYITAYHGDMRDVVIPDSLDGFPVIGLEDGAFADNKSILSVHIGPNIQSIGSDAFAGCEALETVYIEEGLLSIPSRGFRGCIALREITIPQSVTRIRQQAFYGCTALTSVALPSGCKLVGEEAFYGCTSLLDITLPGTRSDCTYGRGAFDGTPWLSTHGSPFVRVFKLTGRAMLLRYIGQETDVAIPNDIYAVGEGAFEDNRTMVTVDLPLSCTKIDDYGFSGCTNLRSITATPRLYRTGTYAFKNCTALETFPYFNTLTSQVSEGTFDGCSSLYDVYLPDSIRRIDAYAFRGCETLVEVTLPKSLREVGKGVFEGCSSLQTVHLPHTLRTIGERAFADCVSLVSLSLPEYMTTIGPGAFMGCVNLTKLVVPLRIVNIAEDAFDGCDQLVLSVIPGSEAEAYALRKGIAYVYHISGSDAFEYRYRFADGFVSLVSYKGDAQTLEITDEVDGWQLDTIEVASLQNLPDVQVIIVPNTVRTVEDWAFSYCTALTEVSFEEGLTHIGADAFSGCTALARVNLPQTVQSIGERAFAGCPNLVLSVVSGSYGEAYALENGIPVEVVG